MGNINVTIFGIIFDILLCIAYFPKKKVDLLENKFYSLLIITSLVGSLIEVVSFIMVLNNISATSFWYSLVLKLLFEFILLWIYVFTLYFVIVTINDDKKSKKIIPFSFLIILAFLLVCTSLNVEIQQQGKLLIPGGPSVNAAYVFGSICIVVMVGLIFKNIKNIKNKKFWPLFIIVFVFSIVIAIQNLYPSSMVIDPAFVFITFLMYFTIENPDIKMIEQLNIERDRADKANSAKTEFLSSMSHEIRTPLNAIVGFSNLLLENKKLPDNAKDEVKDIIMAGDNLLEIVNGILDISKIEAGKLEIIDTEYDFYKIVKELVSLAKGRLGEKPIEFKTNIDESIPKVLYGDSGRLKQIVINILTNAIKYTNEGWIEFKINQVQKDGVCRLIISVEDTGIGIKNENIDKLFDKFERLDLEDNVTIEGTGLGLAITKKLVELMHGKIVVQSVFGKGSKFTVSIDQRIVKNPTINVEEVKEKRHEEVVIDDKKVLLVDDNKVNLKVAQRLLETYSIKSDCLESGFDCIEKIKSGEKYDLILLDDMMPRMSGVETLQKLKELDGFDIPVIALTANALTGMKEKYLNDGFNDYLSKPINKEELNRVINIYLNKEGN